MRALLEKIMCIIGLPDRSFISSQIHTYAAISDLKNLANSCKENGVSDVLLPGVKSNVTVSLTTYSSRIYDIYLVIESIFQQTLKPNKIILWLDEDEFSDETIPLSLKRLQKRGLNIRYCNNIKSYKKLVPTLQLYPDDIIVTIDDDTIYPSDLIERLLKAYCKDTQSIYYTRGHLIRLDNDGSVLPYRQWDRLGDWTPMEKWSAFKVLSEGTPLALPTGVGGILYPPHSLHEDVLREDLFMKLCPYADDIWFKMMAYKNGNISKLVYMEKPFAEKFLSIPNSQDVSLAKMNLKHSGNDPQLRSVLDYYKINFKECL